MALLLGLIAAILFGFSFGGEGSGSTNQGSAPASPSQGAHRAAIRFMSLSPLRVGGRNFKAGEHVRLVVTAGRRTAHKRVTAADGHFVVRISFSADRCSGASAVATGDHGGHAVAALPVAGCPPA